MNNVMLRKKCLLYGDLYPYFWYGMYAMCYRIANQ